MAITLQSLLQSGHVAFILSEVQVGIIGASAPWPALTAAVQRMELIKNAARIAQAARSHGAPVLHCTAGRLPERFGLNTNARLFANARKHAAKGSHDPKLEAPMPEIWQDGDILLPRYHGVSPMTGSPLDSLLRNHGVKTVILSGVSLCFAILNLTFDAVNRGYQVILPHDATAGFPEDYAQAVLANTISMLATVASTDEILAAWAAVPI